MKKIKYCVIPAAGNGTRFLPATKSLPKEMFPIVNIPVMELLVEEAINAGCETIIIVTGRNKRAIEDHFDSNIELEQKLMIDEKYDALKKITKFKDKVNIVYARQPYPLGDGDAILKAEPIIRSEPFLVLFGDDLIDNGDNGAAKQLVKAFRHSGNNIIATTKVRDDEVSSYGIVETTKVDDYGGEMIAGIKEKPKLEDTNSREGIIGKYVVEGDIFDYIRRSKEHGDRELKLANALELKRKENKVAALRVEGERFDTGSKEGFVKANIHYALKDNDIKKSILNYIKDIV